MQGTTGKELLQLDTQMLLDIGMKNPLHRMQLINRREETAAALSSGKAKGAPNHTRASFSTATSLKTVSLMSIMTEARHGVLKLILLQQRALLAFLQVSRQNVGKVQDSPKAPVENKAVEIEAVDVVELGDEGLTVVSFIACF